MYFKLKSIKTMFSNFFLFPWVGPWGPLGLGDPWALGTPGPKAPVGLGLGDRWALGTLGLGDPWALGTLGIGDPGPWGPLGLGDLGPWGP